jgi:hypothetical protein
VEHCWLHVWPVQFLSFNIERLDLRHLAVDSAFGATGHFVFGSYAYYFLHCKTKRTQFSACIQFCTVIVDDCYVEYRALLA